MKKVSQKSLLAAAHNLMFDIDEVELQVLTEEYADIREKMTYLSLPPYSPDLNPIEQVWRKTRREKTHNKYFGLLSKLVEVLDDYFAGFFNPNAQIKSLCCFSCFA